MVRHGQLWADRDSREVKAGKRQRLRVVGIHNETKQVHLNNEDTGVDSWVKRDRLVNRFRLVQEPDLGLVPSHPTDPIGGAR
jgi:hypothetical protein